MDKHEENALMLCITGLSLGALIFIFIYQIPAWILLTIIGLVILMFSVVYGGIYFLSDQYDKEKALTQAYEAEQEKRKTDMAKLQENHVPYRKTNTFTLDTLDDYIKEQKDANKL